MGKIIDSVDVICEHKSDGSVVPMRFRLMNEDGDLEAYTVKGYKTSLFTKSSSDSLKSGIGFATIYLYKYAVMEGSRILDGVTT